MWNKIAWNRWGIVAIVSFAVIAATFIFFAPTPLKALRECKAEAQSDLQIECIFGVIDEALRSQGVGSAMYVFKAAYEEFPNFASGGCHSRSHRLGDMVYFGLYLQYQSFDAIDFTEDTTACGFGFYHGFMEHLIQDHPDPAFITETCDYLQNRLEKNMGDMRITCYHGAGHGLALAHIETLPKSAWGNVAAFTNVPARWCLELPEGSSSDIEQCLEGIYNILVDLMETKQYGFAYDRERPFAVCLTRPQAHREACVYEMAQKLDSASGMDPKQMVRLVRAIPETKLQHLAFGVGIAGVIQQDVANRGGYRDIFEKCRTLDDTYYELCIKSIVAGLFEHGNPQEEYVTALVFCAETSIADRGLDNRCYTTIAERLPRFYGDEKILRVCNEFPQAYREECKRFTRS